MNVDGSTQFATFINLPRQPEYQSLWKPTHKSEHPPPPPSAPSDRPSSFSMGGFFRSFFFVFVETPKPRPKLDHQIGKDLGVPSDPGEVGLHCTGCVLSREKIMFASNFFFFCWTKGNAVDQIFFVFSPSTNRKKDGKLISFNILFSGSYAAALRARLSVRFVRCRANVCVQHQHLKRA